MKIWNRVFGERRKNWRFFVERKNAPFVLYEVLIVAGTVGRPIRVITGRNDEKGDNVSILNHYVEAALTDDECRKIVAKLNGRFPYSLEYIH